MNEKTQMQIQSLAQINATSSFFFLSTSYKLDNEGLISVNRKFQVRTCVARDSIQRDENKNNSNQNQVQKQQTIINKVKQMKFTFDLTIVRRTFSHSFFAGFAKI